MDMSNGKIYYDITNDEFQKFKLEQLSVAEAETVARHVPEERPRELRLKRYLEEKETAISMNTMMRLRISHAFRAGYDAALGDRK